ncbi:MAG: hypothetical protein RSA57_03890 [Cetobacterium sp.]|uniref:hypothetical protein n=1 Tax=Bacteria TaxID=2 RepID=UPI002FCB29E9
MANVNNELRLLNNRGEILCEINTITYYDENNEFDEGETFYIHPLTGSECQTVNQIFQGWSDESKWLNTLAEEIKNDRDLSQKIFNMDIIDYYMN